MCVFIFIPLHWIYSTFSFFLFFDLELKSAAPGKETANQNPVSKWEMNSSSSNWKYKKKTLKKLECWRDSHEIHVHTHLNVRFLYVIILSLLIYWFWCAKLEKKMTHSFNYIDGWWCVFLHTHIYMHCICTYTYMYVYSISIYFGNSMNSLETGMECVHFFSFLQNQTAASKTALLAQI